MNNSHQWNGKGKRTQLRKPVRAVGAWLALIRLAFLLLVALEGLPWRAQGEDVPALFPETMLVKEFQFLGNTVYSSAELARLIAQYQNRRITFFDLEGARLAITTHYINHGYINSGAILEGPPDAQGRVRFRIIEGRLTSIVIQGEKWLRERFYENRLRVGGGQPLNVNSLRNTLQLWRDAYPVEQVNADLKPGALPGEANLLVKVKERFPFHTGIQYANDRPPSTGSEQLNAFFKADSVIGYADNFAFDYGICRSDRSFLSHGRFLGEKDFSVDYSIPITSRDTRLGLQYARNSAAVLEAPFDQLDIQSVSETWLLGLSHPLFRTPTRELTVSCSIDRKWNQTYLLGYPYSFSPGAVDGRSSVTAARLAAQFLDRSARHAFTARAIASQGLDILEATSNNGRPDGHFFSLLGQAQYLRRLGSSRHEVAFRLAGQYSPQPLLSMEQLALGGMYTVRGYRANTMIRDAGVLASAEYRLALWIAKDSRPALQLAPFLDFGAGWNKDRATPSPRDISSAGVGLLFSPRKQIEASLFWGYAFRELNYKSHDLQDDGINFKLTIWAL